MGSCPVAFEGGNGSNGDLNGVSTSGDHYDTERNLG